MAVPLLAQMKLKVVLVVHQYLEVTQQMAAAVDSVVEVKLVALVAPVEHQMVEQVAVAQLLSA